MGTKLRTGGFIYRRKKNEVIKVAHPLSLAPAYGLFTLKVFLFPFFFPIVS